MQAMTSGTLQIRSFALWVLTPLAESMFSTWVPVLIGQFQDRMRQLVQAMMEMMAQRPETGQKDGFLKLARERILCTGNSRTHTVSK